MARMTLGQGIVPWVFCMQSKPNAQSHSNLWIPNMFGCSMTSERFLHDFIWFPWFPTSAGSVQLLPLDVKNRTVFDANVWVVLPKCLIESDVTGWWLDHDKLKSICRRTQVLMETVNQQIQSCQVNLILAPQTNPKILTRIIQNLITSISTSESCLVAASNLCNLSTTLPWAWRTPPRWCFAPVPACPSWDGPLREIPQAATKTFGTESGKKKLQTSGCHGLAYSAGKNTSYDVCKCKHAWPQWCKVQPTQRTQITLLSLSNPRPCKSVWLDVPWIKVSHSRDVELDRRVLWTAVGDPQNNVSPQWQVLLRLPPGSSCSRIFNKSSEPS